MLSPTNRQLIADTFGLLVVDPNARPDGMVHIAEEGLNRLLDAARAQPAAVEGAAGESAIDLARRCTQTIAAQYGPDSDCANGARMVLAALICAPTHPSPTPAADVVRSQPDDPTEEMIQAALEVDFDNEDERGAVINLWHVMIAAAPPAAVKRTMTVNLTDEEMAVLEALAEKKDLDGPRIFRLALRQLQLTEHEREHGPIGSGPLGLVTPADDALRVAVEAWDELAKRPSWEINFSGFDEEDGWSVHSVTGGVNDREWDELARAETPLEAVLAALKAGGVK